MHFEYLNNVVDIRSIQIVFYSIKYLTYNLQYYTKCGIMNSVKF